jgi:hypothetical protein
VLEEMSQLDELEWLAEVARTAGEVQPARVS